MRAKGHKEPVGTRGQASQLPRGTSYQCGRPASRRGHLTLARLPWGRACRPQAAQDTLGWAPAPWLSACDPSRYSLDKGHLACPPAKASKKRGKQCGLWDEGGGWVHAQ